MRSGGFTLIEVLAGLAIAGVVTTLAAVGIRSAVTGSAAQADALLTKTITSDLNTMLAQPGFDGFIPITGTVGSIPVSGTFLPTVSAAAIQQAACFENVLLGFGVISTPYKFAYLGARGFETVPLQYKPALHAFFTAGDVAPMPGTLTAAPRVLTALATPGVTPGLALGANFWLTPKQDLPAGSMVFYVYYPQLDAGQARALAAKLNAPSARLPAANQELDDGPVAYGAANAGNKTDVYVYLLSR